MGHAILCVAIAAAAATTSTDPSATPPPAATVTRAPEAAPPPPDVVAGERPDGRTDSVPPRRWRLVPQVLLFPLRAIFWGLEWPIGGALRLEDRVHVFKRVSDALTWSGGTRGLRPAFYYSTITVPEFGAMYFDRRTLGVDTRLDVTATVGGANYVYGQLTVEPTKTSGPVGLVWNTTFDRRGDLLFNGIGGHTYSNAATGRYLQNAFVTDAGLRYRPFRGLEMWTLFSVGVKRFDNGDRVGGDPGVVYVYETSGIPGFNQGTTFVRPGAGFELDTRDSPLRSAVGLVVRGAFDYTHGIAGDVATYERFAGNVGIPINLWSRTHILWLAATSALTWQNDAQVPFSELPTLGGPNDLRGFRFQDFRDYSAFYVTAEYRWPVWMWVDGSIFFDYGGVFSQNYANFSAQRMQPDVGVAMRLFTANRFYIRAQLGYGFGEGFNFSLAGSPQ